MPAFCPHCGGAVTDEARYCASCGRPTTAPAPAPSPATPPPPASPPAVPGTAQVPSAAATALTRLVTGDWIAPARIAALPTALLLLVSLVLTATAAADDAPFGAAFLTALAVVLSALGAHPGLELTERGSASLASLDLSFMPLGLTLLWAAALWFGARLHLRGAAAAGRQLGTTETLFLGVRSVLSAVLGSVLLAWTAGTSVALASSDASDASAVYVARLLDLSDVTVSVTCSPLRAAWWTLLLASLVLFPTLGRTSMSAWAARRPGLGDWLRAARRAGVALAVPLSLVGLGAVVFVVSQAGLSALIPALLLAPNMAATLLGLACGASVEFTNTLTDSSSWNEGGDGSDTSTAVSLFELHDLSGWVWASVLLGVVAALVLGAGVLRESVRPAAAVRAAVCFVSGFLLLAVMAGVGLELSSDIDDSSALAWALSTSLDLSTTDGSALTVGPAIPGVLFAATVWAALGAFGVPAAARRLGITRIEDVPGVAAFVGRLTGRARHTAPAVAPAPVSVAVPVPASSPVPVAAAPALPVAAPVSPQAPEVPPAGMVPLSADEPSPSTDSGDAENPADPEPEPEPGPVEAADGRPAETSADEAAPAQPEPTAAPTGSTEPTAEAAGTAQEPTEPEDEPKDEPAGPTAEPTEKPAEQADEPAVAPEDESFVEPAEQTPTAVDAPPASPPAPPAFTPVAGLPKSPATAHPGAQPQAAPAGAETHAAAFAGLPTGSMAYPGSPHQVVHAPEQPRPVRRRIGWGVITATVVASAVL
ncbi:hypothetical protein ACWEBX_38430, partial [Streptomyces sp. NPDC005070]